MLWAPVAAKVTRSLRGGGRGGLDIVVAAICVCVCVYNNNRRSQVSEGWKGNESKRQVQSRNVEGSGCD